VTPNLMVRSAAIAENGRENGNGHFGAAQPASAFLIKAGKMVAPDGHFPHENGQAAVLTSWKDIARYMGKGVRTVQRWEQDFGLPVRRPYGSNKKAILARPRDLDAWVAMRCQSRSALEISIDAATGLRDGHLARLTSLNAEMETHRMLRENNRELMREFHTALEQLRVSIVAIEINKVS
jgi:hypothetical protein